MPPLALTIAPTEALTVLVADDIEASRSEMIQIVQSLGHSTIEARSGAEALQMITRHDPDVALLDLIMPEMDGFEVAQAVRRQVVGKWLPVIVLSSLEGDEFLDRALAMGAADYLIKPVKPGILRAKLRQYQRVLSMQSRLTMMAQRHHAIHEHIVDAIITIDHEGIIHEVNRAARLLFDLDDERVQSGVRIMALTGMDIGQLLSQTEIDMVLAGGQTQPFAVSYKYWQIGAQEFCTIALHDLSEIRRVERMKDEFLATVSHELRTPLTSIVGALGLITAGAGGTLPEAATELAQVAKRNGDRLSHLIDDVLDLTKLEGNRMPLNQRPVALAPIIRESIAVNTVYAQRVEVRIAFEDAPQECRVQVDPDRFMQVMANLLSNAIKHSPREKTVRVVLRQDFCHAQVDVIDEGPGIDPAFKKKLFEKFSQADSSDRRAVGGTGLGLYISRMLMEKMNGTISAEAAPGGGTVFRLTLPRIQQASTQPWLLCIASDRHYQERMADWLSELGKVETASDLDAAQEAVARLGAPSALLANPQAQGPTDAFCKQLAALTDTARIALIGAAVSPGFSARHGIAWLAQGASRQETIQRASALMAGAGEGDSLGKI